MITINQFKKLLGKDARGLNDKQIEKLHADMYTLADASIGKWLYAGKPARAYMFDLADPTFREEFFWYPSGIRPTMPR